MRIEFEIREELSDIITEILHSDKWQSMILEEGSGFKRVSIKDLHFDSNAAIEIWPEEIHIRTAWSNYTYRIFRRNRAVFCEYIGAYRGLLEQNLLPQLTPKENILDAIVTESSLVNGEEETLRQYSEKSILHKQAQVADDAPIASDYHPQVVYDEYIKTGVPMPPVR
ncbi:hypothetical protein LJC44_04280 [Parabacteroides sp. OttesenSCG-928-G06]|nr:hypothetical protein [Parabacteroides sp. OttesenSCG-928-G06]